jgi:hypothetical protein
MQTIEWRDAWQDRLVYLRADDRQLPNGTRDFLVSFGMPRRVIFECRSSFEISFAPVEAGLTPYNTLVQWGDFYNAAFDRAWSNELVIGDEDFCNGSACYSVQRESGQVSRIDCELSKPQTFVNSSVAQFGMSLLVSKKWSANMRAQGVVPSFDSFTALARELERIDEKAFQSDGHYWRNLIEVFLEEKDFELEITDDPAKSKPRF